VQLPSLSLRVTIRSRVRLGPDTGRKERAVKHADASIAAEPAGPARGWPAVATYARFVRVAHTLFSLPLVIAGMLVAAAGLHRAGAEARLPSLRAVLLVLLAAAGARTAALALNRIIDRRIDAQNPRTAARELPSGRMTSAQAWGVAVAGVVLYLAAAALLTRPGGRLTLWLSPIPLAVFTGYPFLKRCTPLCHFGVGLGLALSPLGGWVAVTQSFAGLPQVVPLALFGLFWVSGFDVIYATLDEEFDRACGVHSLPAALGRAGALRISYWLHFTAVLCLLALWWVNGWSGLSLALLAPAAVLLWWEQRLSQVVETPFFTINILIGFAVLLFTAAGVLG
jgi:4-hydroxybenzoate polyprenyltransferase